MEPIDSKIYVVETYGNGVEKIYRNESDAREYLFTYYLTNYMPGVIHDESSAEAIKTITEDWNSLCGSGYIEEVGTIYPFYVE